MTTEPTLFDLPTTPDEFSVLLPPSELRKINFSALEFATARRAVIEYIKTYFPDDFNDFVSNNGVIMLMELMSYLTGIISMRGDLLANQGFLPTATSDIAVSNHLALINQKIRRATPAVVDVECAVDTAVPSNIAIPAGQQFTVSGEDGSITYEVYRSPTDLTSDIVIPASKRGVIAYGVEGRTETLTQTSDGTAKQKFTINTNENVLEYPIRVSVSVGVLTDDWNQIDVLEQAGPQDKVYEVHIFNGHVDFMFGDNQTGLIPTSGASIKFTYRVGGGARGRIGVGVISGQRVLSPNYPYTAPVPVSFTNITPSSGGVDTETIDQAKRRAPRDYATHDSIITESDYAQLVGSFNSPTFGSVAKAVATVRTGLNANLVELYILAEGPDGPISPNEGLKRAVQSYVDELNTLTDSVSVLGAANKPVDIELTVVMSRSADASIVKTKVEQSINDFFNIKNWDLGEALYIAHLYDLISNIDGVKYVDMLKPADNILATGELAGVADGVGINELITLRNKQIRYYYEAIR